MAEEIKVEKQEEDWMTKKWRPMMAMMYMICCLCDFALFPIMFTVVQFWEVQAANDAFRQWVPITLQGGGLFHVAMGRTQEKLGSATTAGTSVATPTLTTATPVVPVQAPVVAPAPAPVVVAQAPTYSAAPVVTGFGGKAAPPPAPQPEI
jgi:hypothetical protein